MNSLESIYQTRKFLEWALEGLDTLQMEYSEPTSSSNTVKTKVVRNIGAAKSAAERIPL